MLDIMQMQELQRCLQERYAGWWEPVDAERGLNKLMWMLAEVGEAAQILKRKGYQGVMEKKETRAEFVEELCDVLMFFNDALLCYEITPEELEEAYRAKHARNMTRWKKPVQNDSREPQNQSLTLREG